MRYRVLLLVVVPIAIGVGLHQGWFHQAHERAATAALSDDARLAITVRCQGRHTAAAKECRTLLRKLYLAGALDPDKTLRQYCDSVRDAPWGGQRPTQPALCIERYGVWRDG